MNKKSKWIFDLFIKKTAKNAGNEKFHIVAAPWNSAEDLVDQFTIVLHDLGYEIQDFGEGTDMHILGIKKGSWTDKDMEEFKESYIPNSDEDTCSGDMAPQ